MFHTSTRKLKVRVKKPPRTVSIKQIKFPHLLRHPNGSIKEIPCLQFVNSSGILRLTVRHTGQTRRCDDTVDVLERDRNDGIRPVADLPDRVNLVSYLLTVPLLTYLSKKD